MSYKLPTTREEAEALDEHDILGHARELFDLPSGLIYLVGHSLGPATHNALDAADRAGRQDWRDGLVSSWNTAGWFDLSRTVGAQIARLIGAQREEVIVTDSVSLNLYKLAHAAIPLARAACLIVEADEFPTDQYMIEALAGDSGAAFERAPAGGGLTRLEETGGILVLSAVNYRTAELRDMAAMEERAMAAGGVIIWDLSHATGVIALDLAAVGVRFAAGCTYKYLNGGPGAPAFVFIRQDLITGLDTALPGWMGHARPFAFEPEYDPAPDIRRFASGTPPILSLTALSGALEVFEGLDLGLVQDKARALGDMVLHHTGAIGLESSSPRDSTWRGGHVSVRHPGGYEIVQALKAENILADFRAPGTIRFGGSPLYLGFADIWDAMETLADILETRRWDNDRFRQRAPVT